MRTAKTIEIEAPLQESTFSLRSAIRHLLPLIIINIVLPLIIYRMITRFWNVSDMVALAVAALPPLFNTIITLLVKKRIDLLGGLVLLGFALGFALVFITGNTRFLFLRETLVHGLFGVLCLITLIRPEPMAFTVYTYLRTGGSFAPDATLHWQWQDQTVRYTFRIVTLIGGIALIILALLHMFLVFSLSITQFLTIAPLISIIMDVLVLLWVVGSIRSALRRAHTREVV